MSADPRAVGVETVPAASGHPWARFFIPAAVATLVLDQISKALVEPWWRSGEAPSWIRWDYNTGVAWSMFNRHPELVALVTIVLIPLLAWIWWRQFRGLGPWENLAFGCILGGAVGNGIDRVAALFGAMPGVRDFLHVDLGFPPADPWPTFNIADAGITTGFLVLLSRSFLKPTTSAAASPSSASSTERSS